MIEHVRFSLSELRATVADARQVGDWLGHLIAWLEVVTNRAEIEGALWRLAGYTSIITIGGREDGD